MTTQTEICNWALRKLGEGRIADLNEDSAAARILKDIYPLVRDAVMEDHPWNFGIARALLAEDSTPPAWGAGEGAGHRYPLPPDFLRLVEISGEDIERFTVEGGYILTDLDAALKLRYVARCEDESRFSGLFKNALAARLAYELAEPITQNTQKKQAMADDYGDALRRAKRSDSMQGTVDPLYADPWVRARE